MGKIKFFWKINWKSGEGFSVEYFIRFWIWLYFKPTWSFLTIRYWTQVEDKKWDTIFEISDPETSLFHTLFDLSSKNFNFAHFTSGIWILNERIETGWKVWLDIRNRQPKETPFWYFVWHALVWKFNSGWLYQIPFWGRDIFYSEKNRHY